MGSELHSYRRYHFHHHFYELLTLIVKLFFVSFKQMGNSKSKNEEKNNVDDLKKETDKDPNKPEEKKEVQPEEKKEVQPEVKKEQQLLKN